MGLTSWGTTMSDSETPDNEALEEDEEIILADLDDEDLTAQMHDDLYDGLAEEIAEGTNILLAVGGVPTRSSTMRWSRVCESLASTFATASSSCQKFSWPRIP